MSKLVTLASFDNAVEAHMLRSQLERAEIPSFILDENIVTLNPLANNIGMGGIKVQVMDDDYAAAVEIVHSVVKKPLVNFDNSVVVCPSCRSAHVSPGVKSASIFGVAFWGFLLGMYPLGMKSKYYCHDCETTFKRDEANTPQVS